MAVLYKLFYGAFFLFSKSSCVREGFVSRSVRSRPLLLLFAPFSFRSFHVLFVAHQNPWKPRWLPGVSFYSRGRTTLEAVFGCGFFLFSGQSKKQRLMASSNASVIGNEKQKVDDPMKQTMLIIEHKIRNLEKRKVIFFFITTFVVLSVTIYRCRPLSDFVCYKIIVTFPIMFSQFALNLDCCLGVCLMVVPLTLWLLIVIFNLYNVYHCWSCIKWAFSQFNSFLPS